MARIAVTFVAAMFPPGDEVTEKPFSEIPVGAVFKLTEGEATFVKVELRHALHQKKVHQYAQMQVRPYDKLGHVFPAPKPDRMCLEFEGVKLDIPETKIEEPLD